MPVTITERNVSPDSTTRSVDGGEMIQSYIVEGAADAASAIGAGSAEGTVQTIAGRVYRLESKTVERARDAADTTWYMTQNWRAVGSGISNGSNVTFDFDITQGTEHMEVAYAQLDYERPAAGAPHQHGQIIGSTQDGVEGCDVVRPAMRVVVTDSFAKASFTSSYITKVYNLRGTVNAATTGIFPAHCGLFLGARFRYMSSSYVERTFEFAYGVTETRQFNIEGVGPTNVTRYPFNYVWFAYDKTEVNPGGENAIVVHKLKGVHVAQVYKEVSWNDLAVTLSLP